MPHSRKCQNSIPISTQIKDALAFSQVKAIKNRVQIELYLKIIEVLSDSSSDPVISHFDTFFIQILKFSSVVCVKTTLKINFIPYYITILSTSDQSGYTLFI